MGIRSIQFNGVSNNRCTRHTIIGYRTYNSIISIQTASVEVYYLVVSNNTVVFAAEKTKAGLRHAVVVVVVFSH